MSTNKRRYETLTPEALREFRDLQEWVSKSPIEAAMRIQEAERRIAGLERRLATETPPWAPESRLNVGDSVIYTGELLSLNGMVTAHRGMTGKVVETSTFDQQVRVQLGNRTLWTPTKILEKF